MLESSQIEIKTIQTRYTSYLSTHFGNPRDEPRKRLSDLGWLPKEVHMTSAPWVNVGMSFLAKHKPDNIERLQVILGRWGMTLTYV